MTHGMEDFWERFAGWVIAGFFAVCTSFLALWRRWAVQDIKELKMSDGDLAKLVHANTAKITEHEMKLRINDVHIESIRTDVADIKCAVGRVHDRIDKSDKAMNEKLDRILARGETHGV